MPTKASALEAFLAEAPDSQLVVSAHEPGGEPGRYERVAIVVRDRAELRALVVTKGIRSAAVAIRLEQGTSALSLTPRPEWPPLELIRSRNVDHGWLTVLRFASPAPVHAVVAELARQSVWPDRTGHRGLVVGHTGNNKVPADVVLADWHLTSGESDHPVTGRRPLVLTHGETPVPLGPIDERVLNPIGFVTDPTGPVVELPGTRCRPKPWSVGSAPPSVWGSPVARCRRRSSPASRWPACR